jgi:hypothetical protein
MKKNVGGIDRTLRIIAGIALLAVGFSELLSGWLRAAVFVVGIVALLTGFFSL